MTVDTRKGPLKKSFFSSLFAWILNLLTSIAPRFMVRVKLALKSTQIIFRLFFKKKKFVLKIINWIKDTGNSPAADNGPLNRAQRKRYFVLIYLCCSCRSIWFEYLIKIYIFCQFASYVLCQYTYIFSSRRNMPQHILSAPNLPQICTAFALVYRKSIFK